MDCLFCSIARRDIPASIVYEDEEVIVFNDIDPQAPVHVLIIPKKHISTVNDLPEEDSLLIGKMLLIARDLAKRLDVSEDGYRIVINCNSGAGQTVFHIHAHLLGGRTFRWPPG